MALDNPRLGQIQNRIRAESQERCAASELGRENCSGVETGDPATKPWRQKPFKEARQLDD
ncbi:hypothetical protein D1O30_08800 [Methylocystis hirsuta]|uniref:Uncharacterized protein n=1 Tax=Methylocystis hirsuta TaxID=369798 RepID=A0A3M9XPU0_9HYPH|nr:hypothetical protein D1O30_08800 [Methylocystis hirsuta]